jgi:hypothetical protein
MLKGYKHTVECSECQETTQMFDDIDEALALEEKGRSKCCEAPYKYIGFQPYRESIIKAPEFMAGTKTDDLVIERDLSNIPKANTEVERTTVEPPVAKIAEVKTIQVSPTEYADIPQIKEKIIFEPVVEKTDIISKQEATGIKLSDIIQIGSRGVNNSNMIPAMKAALDENSIEKLKLLKSSYPVVFDASTRYLGKKYQDKLAVFKI